MSLHSPTNETEAAAVIGDARARGVALTIVGGGTRGGFGRPQSATETLSTQALTGVTLYEPAEMVISARTGTPLAEIEARLATRGQMLPFEPGDPRVLFGSTGEPTIGGVACVNASGPRRISAGAARDHLLGVRLINGRGEAVKSGGRVTKNVTGLDLVKLNCGAFGTLGLLTEVTFKVLPKPPAAATLVFEGLDERRAIECLSMALGSPFEVSGAAHLPAWTGTARTVIRIEHFPESVAYRLGALRSLLGRFGEPGRVEGEANDALWRDIRDVRMMAGEASDAVWRICVAPTRSPQVVARIAAGLPVRCLYDWGGGLVWLATPGREDCGATLVREAVATTGGHATLVRAPLECRARLPVFQPLAGPLLRLTIGVKKSFDPDGVLNPGRMYAGI